MNQQDPNRCPCGLPGDLESCCGRYCVEGEPAPSPEALMRSRYCAFTLGTPQAVEYLIETHHPDFRAPHMARSLEATMRDVHWERMEVLEAAEDGDRGVVEFVAIYTHDERLGKLQERSSFVRENGRWRYTVGVLDPAENGPL